MNDWHMVQEESVAMVFRMVGCEAVVPPNEEWIPVEKVVPLECVLGRIEG